MERQRLFEFEDQSWFPQIIKDGVTDNLQMGLSLFGTYDVIIPRLEKLLQRTGATTVLDVCSGGAGPWRRILQRLQDRGVSIRVILSDRFPNPTYLQRSKGTRDQLEYWPDPVDARDIPKDLSGIEVRTLFSALHHFQDSEIREMVACCINDGASFGAFEFTERRLKSIPISAFTAFVTTLFFAPTFWRGFHPLALMRWLLGIALSPVTALVNAWDGAVSVMRTHKPHEIAAVIDSVEGSERYQWDIGIIQAKPGDMPANILFVIGTPR